MKPPDDNSVNPDVSIIIVNWNLKDYLRSCLKSVAQFGGNAVETIVVDNASTDGSADMVEKDFPEVQVIRNHENVGFSRANNQAIDVARGRYYFLLNNDTLLYDGSLPLLMEFMDNHANAGICGPRVINEDRSFQVRSKGKFPSIKTALGHFFLTETWQRNRNRPPGFYEFSDEMAIRQVDWVSGCALLARREAVDTIGLLDAEVFMYCEDVDWCYRMAKAGWQVYYVPSSLVLHYAGKSMKKQKGKVVGAHRAGLIAFYSKYHSRFNSAIFEIVLWAGYSVQVAGWICDSFRGRGDGMEKLGRVMPGIGRFRKKR